MIFLGSLTFTALLYWAVSRKHIADYRVMIYLMSTAYVFSLLPSLSIPYIFDDVDHFHNLAWAQQNHQIWAWLLAPHNEHVIPLLKLLYIFCYQYFWLNPESFHLIVLAVCLGIIALVYRLIFIFTGSELAALAGGAIMAASNLTDDAIFVGTNSHIFFCMFFFLLLFYAIHQYAAQREFKWKAIAFIAILLGPSTFALGLTAVVFAPLFWRWCLSAPEREKSKDIFSWLSAGWVLSLVPYLYAMDAIIHARHYHDVGAGTAFEAARILAPARFLGEYVALKLIPAVFANPYLAFGLFFLCAFTALSSTKQLAWSRILFFAVFGLFNNFIIFVFREKWGTAGLDTARYYVFPLIMIAFSYGLTLSVFFQKTTRIKQLPIALVVYLSCFLAVANGSAYRYHNAELLLKETMVMQSLYVNFRKAFVDYVQTHPIPGPLQVKDGDILMPSVSRLAPKGGSAPAISRYPIQTRKFYAQYVLPSSINQKIIWSERTDPDFQKYLNEREYFFLTDGEQ